MNRSARRSHPLSSPALLGAALTLFLVATPVQAQNRVKDLQPGLSVPQVLKAWGEPKEKSELEVKRGEIWRYPEGAFVVFSEGKVVKWRLTNAETAHRDAVARAQVEDVSAKQDTAPESDTRDLVREIAREVPSGPDVVLPEPDVAVAIPGTNLLPGQNQMGISPGVQIIPQPID